MHVVPPTPSAAVAASCARLGDYLPQTIEKAHSRVIEPRSPLVHVWGKPPIVARCGVPLPSGYNPASAETTEVDGVSWFQQVHGDAVTWTAIRPGANVELSVPTSYDAQGAFLVDLAPAISRAFPG